MLTALLLVACAAPASPEWVEISQQHYRKPVRITHSYPAVDEEPVRLNHPDEEGSTPMTNPIEEPVRFAPGQSKDPVRLTPNYNIEDHTGTGSNIPKRHVENAYSNHSISEYTWNRNKYRNRGNVKHVDADDMKFASNPEPDFSVERYGPVTDETHVLATRNRLKDEERVGATIERVPNKANVRRVQLSNTPVKSPVINDAHTIGHRRNNDHSSGVTPTSYGLDDEFDIKSDIFKDVHDGEIFRNSNKEEHGYSENKKTPVNSYDKMSTSTSKITAEPSERYHKYPTTQLGNQENILPVKENNVSNANIRPKQTKRTEDIKVDEVNRINKDFSNSKINNYSNDKLEFEDITVNNSPNDNSRPLNVKGKRIRGEEQDNFNNDSNKDDNKPDPQDIKVNTMENLMRFMKVVADTITKNTRRGVNSKVRYLHDLKDTLLGSIQDRIDATWPDDESDTPARRRSRSATARGHVEFPSSESALMTISFLTFAVFLIKLVLQVIQTYKNKAMMVAPLVVASSGRTIKKLRSPH